jgi:GGDEF domain-containing protein
MLESVAAPTVFRERLRLDTRPLHSALAQAAGAMEVLDVCQATTTVLGADVWLAAYLHPEPRSLACASAALPDAALLQVIDEMQTTARAGAVPDGAALATRVIARWRDATTQADRLAADYAQLELGDAGQFRGLLRVGRIAGGDHEACDWEAVEEVMCVAAPYLILCQHRDTREVRVDPITGLCTPTEFTARVEREVELARARPVELALVVMEVRLDTERAVSVLHENELRHIGQVIRQTLRDTDSATRLPDGRFALLLPMTSQRHALIAASRVVDRVRSHPEIPAALSCQMGVSGWTFEGPTAPELFDQARSALDGARLAGARGAFLFI